MLAELAVWAALACCAAVGITALLRLRRATASLSLLLAAVSVQAIWTAVVADAEGASPVVLIIAEWIRLATWVLVVGAPLWPLYSRNGYERSMRIGTALGALALLVGVAIIGRADVTDAYRLSFWSYGSLGLATLGLVGTEQLYRSSSPVYRRTIRWFCLGVGGLLAIDVLLYAQTLLIMRVDLTLLTARIWLNLPFLAMLWFYARHVNLRGTAQLYVSREVVFYTVSLTALGIYVFALAAGGYWLNRQGLYWSLTVQIVYAIAAAAVLLVTLFMWQWRRRLRVFISKHFYRNRYDYRAEWLRLIRTLTSADSERSLQERSIIGIAEIVDSPGGALWVADEDQNFAKAGQTSDDVSGPSTLAATDHLVEFLWESKWIVDSRQYAEDPSEYDNQPLGLDRFGQAPVYVVPLLHDQALIGFCVLRQPVAAQTLNFEDHDLLKTVGKQVATYLLQARTSHELTQARQFEAFNKFSAFVMHDVKNAIAQLSLVVQNAARHRDNPAFFDDAMSTVNNTVIRMERLLRSFRSNEPFHRVGNVRVAALCQEAVNRTLAFPPEPQLCGSADDAATLQVAVDFEQGVSILCHLIRNAQDATPVDGFVEVGYRRVGDDIEIEVSDSGSGMTQAFIDDRLFRPFDSTKGAKGMGIGAYQVRQFARNMNGELRVASAPGEGSRMTLVLPAHNPEP